MKKSFLLAAGILITLFSKDLLAYNQISDFPSVKATQKNYDLALEAFNQASTKLSDAQSNVTTLEKLHSEKILRQQKLEKKREEFSTQIGIMEGAEAMFITNISEGREALAKVIGLLTALKGEISKIESDLIAARKLSKSLGDSLAQSQVILENTRQKLNLRR